METSARWDWIRLGLSLAAAVGFTVGLIVIAVSNVMNQGLFLMMTAIPAGLLYGDAARIACKLYDRNRAEKAAAKAAAAVEAKPKGAAGIQLGAQPSAPLLGMNPSSQSGGVSVL